MASAALLAGYLLVPRYLYVTSDALVQGELVPVAPLYRARIDQLFVKCGDTVKAGQKLAVISNFLVQADYAKEYEQARMQTQLSEITLQEGVAEAKSEGEAARQKYLAAADEEERLKEIFASYDRAYQAGAIGEVEWHTKRDAWKAAQALAESAHEAWALAQQRVERVGVDAQEKIRSSEEASNRSRALVERTGGETISAPVSGYVVNCVDREQIVLDAGAKMFDIFDPDHAYGLAFFDPDSIAKLHVGQSVEMHVSGMTQPLSGQVSVIYPTLAELPAQLARFFWQHVQWSEYRPVRISFNNLPQRLRRQLYYNAQANVRIRVRDVPHIADLPHLLSLL